MREQSKDIHNSKITTMLDYGFNTYQINIILTEDINILNTKSGTKRNVNYNIEIKSIKAPVKKRR